MKHVSFKISTLLISTLFAQNAIASGYHFGTQSVGAQSTANAAAAEAADASTIFSNPAGLTKLDGRGEFTISGNLVFPSIKYGEAKGTYYNSTVPVTGSDSGKITEVTFAPHMYGAYKLNDKVTLGLGMYIPFGSKTEYDENSVLRYNINKLGLTTIAIEPAIAYQATPQHSFGVGLIGQYSQAELRKYADWNASGRLGTHNGLSDGRGDIKGHDWGFGYHLGWMFDVNDRVRVGVNYRSKVEHNLKGTAKWDAVGPAVNPNSANSLPIASMVQPVIQAPVSQGGRGYVPTENASVKIVTPESLAVHGMYKATDKLNLFGDVTWTRHSRFNKAELMFENQKQVVNGFSNKTVITPNWRDTYKVAVGGSYQYSEPLQLRAGIAFDQSPIKTSQDRLNTMPDANRIWYSVGARYTHKKNHVFETAFTYVDIKDSNFKAEQATGSDVDSKGATSARFKTYASILGMQYTYRF
ncbi:OmpP1/FadL family transporter [Wielerella bovis]|uniref:OmpP1/FadL family transporter n=1 Tax=Wielerella bovis TaxID=2917790 RepID=UPI00201A1E84|nr:OmpP1/FadL family transporter [Wielerella bovis]ULJ60511.1 OmpP1/FadL family transporter [Wielerella bovis]ULJ62720.1 OmpP1/FadL family transporter [Wielerella bovis]ULJ64950.1 OmpP1/FadL family transporter [Wielerella bovis]ULJ67224.1 OmpP1/FadL family transporter [Wielerella bovis]